MNSLLKQPDRVWYFAYGSNMSSEVFRGHRSIDPLAAISVVIPGWTLTFDIYGIPYKEPGYSSIAKQLTPSQGPYVQGTAYLVTREQYISIISSEGGGIAYAEQEVVAYPVGCSRRVLSENVVNKPFMVMTLVTAFGSSSCHLPSRRYIDIIVQGAQEACLSDSYHDYLERIPCYTPPSTKWRQLGAGLFLSFWLPIMSFAEILTKTTVNYDGKGNCPALVKGCVRLIVWSMWIYHDLIHARIWGRGDVSIYEDLPEKGWLPVDPGELELCS